MRMRNEECGIDDLARKESSIPLISFLITPIPLVLRAVLQRFGEMRLADVLRTPQGLRWCVQPSIPSSCRAPRGPWPCRRCRAARRFLVQNTVLLRHRPGERRIAEDAAASIALLLDLPGGVDALPYLGGGFLPAALRGHLLIRHLVHADVHVDCGPQVFTR